MSVKNLRNRRYKFRNQNGSLKGMVDTYVKAINTPGTAEYNEMKAWDNFFDTFEEFEDGGFSIGNVPDYIENQKPE